MDVYQGVIARRAPGSIAAMNCSKLLAASADDRAVVWDPARAGATCWVGARYVASARFSTTMSAPTGASA